MKHRNHSFKLGRTVSHRRCLIANLLKSLILNGSIETSLTKAKELRRYADRMVTLAKRNTLESRRAAIARMMVRFNPLTPKEARLVKTKNDTSAFNGDRHVVKKLFEELGPRFQDRNGGYTRIIKMGHRVGDSAPVCRIEYLAK